jgi:hypothetical protein
MAEEESPPSPEPRPRFSDLDAEEPRPYAVSASSEEAPSKLPLPDAPAVSKLEEALAAPRRLPPLPAWPLVTGVYSFPFYTQTMGPCGTLAFGFFAVIALLRLLLHLLTF